jgi:rod shape-determining protein MreC
MGLIRRNLVFITAAMLLACSVQLLGFSVDNPETARFGTSLVSSALYPVQKLHHEVTQSTNYAWNRYLWLLDVEEERNELLVRVGSLETLNSRLLEFKRENQRLKQILEFVETSDYRGVTASVISRDPSNWSKTVTIDRGSRHGLRVGMAVTYGNGVVGQIVSVTNQSSKVLLITDPSSAVDALLQDNRAWGICEGTGNDDFLLLRYVEKQVGVEVVAGDRVIASGLDGIFPKGTLIGVVHSVDASTNSLFYEIKVRRTVDLRRLETVFVIFPVDIDKAAKDPLVSNGDDSDA